ncbi:hypothetical protein [Mesobacillus selenatarsenatis]|uniref:Uncharacterized protein n=1 Tax=Mesobacillus selenatarsenatis (strain DSM 18680 / JCM 14380 / FERM P-15431 / SF-1) TaxID=1321606 RepID=A0A0A8X4S3_MESS1|nr:hypothetical protein [Mesobacillus selenatarsenatis]GAM14960.1 hypothetical protein SAMD00020551_3116 [Mesobacillus selenatarsenatis SF-1]
MEVQFTVPWSYSDEVDTTFPLPDDYEYWRPLVKHFLERTDTVEIHCWNEEQEAIQGIQSVLNSSVQVGSHMTIIEISNDKNVQDILLNKYKKNNRFKWFTVNLMFHGEVIFHSGHWATEFAFTARNTEEALWIQGVTPRNTDFFFY